VALDKAAKAAKVQVFVIEGSRAWLAWLDHRRRSGRMAAFPTCTGTGEFANRRGWYFPSLFPPPASTGPPSLMTADDEAEAAKGF
jgi:hypothetical protein